MKVGVHFGFDAPESGGVFTFQVAVSKALAQLAGHSRHTFVVFASPSLAMEPTPTIDVISLRRTLGIRVRSRVYRELFSLKSRLLGHGRGGRQYIEEKPIVNSGVDMIWYVGPFCYSMDIPYVYTVLDLQHLLQPYFPEVSNHGVWDIRENHYSVALRRAARVVISTHVGKSEIERFYQVPSERIVVLPYAAPTFDFAAGDTGERVLAKYGLRPGFLFYPAQFWPQKNHVGLLEAVRILRDRWNIRIPVVFVGSDKGNVTFVKDSIRQLGLSDQVHMLGFVPRADIIALYRHALAMTMPTLVGPDNIPSLEAFALGCPVITSQLPGFDEQLGDAAVLVDPTDEVAIAQAIKRIYEDTEFRRVLVARGFERVRPWTWQDYVKGVLAIFDEFEPIRRTWPGSSQVPGHKRVGVAGSAE